MGGMMADSVAPGSMWPVGLPLHRLQTLQNASTLAGEFQGTLMAAPFVAHQIDGRPKQLWGYNDSYPGPLIELYEGQQVSIDFLNALDIESTIHWHGLAVPADQDGSPMDPVPPGARRRYEFEVPVGSAGTYWYHPHAHRTTTLQVAHGLVAPLIVRSAVDPLQGIAEQTLMITSLAIDSGGEVLDVRSRVGGMGGMMMADAGEVLVNGQRLPIHRVNPGATERWRILNATADQYVRLAVDGHRFSVVGTDGGLLAQPLTNVGDWLLAPAQRVEIVLTVAARQSETFMLRDLGYRGGARRGIGAALMALETTETSEAEPIELPSTLRPIAALGPASIRQRMVLSSTGMGMMGSFLINGRSFDMNRVDLTTEVNRIELWDLVNATMLDHPMHVHGTQFQVIGRTVRGRFVPASYPAWLDTVNVPAGETVTIKTQQLSAGKRMFHCHLLPHEDAGMMGVLEVLPA
jgi:bilirubin oxidase